MYALKQSEEANYQLALDHVKDVFAPDMMSLEPQDKVKLEGQRKLTSLIFEEKVRGKVIEKDESLMGPEVEKAVRDTVDIYRNNNKRDLSNTVHVMATEVERVGDSYMLFLQILIQTYDIIEKELSAKYRVQETPNAFIDLMRSNAEVKKSLLSAAQEEEIQDILNILNAEELKKDDVLINYFRNTNTDFEKDRELVGYLFKDYLWQQPRLVAFFEEYDLGWAENRSSVKSMVAKTIKSLEQGMDKKDILISLSPNWEDDSRFLRDLFLKTHESEERYDDLIAKKLENWDVERVNIIDQVILKMALTEMVIFPAIPVKVTINEFIEISKNYSTPKSKQFINGLLDKLALELTEKGLIKKSGRGLLDTK